jgi:predicted ArsR family transcriptional regulator
MDLTDVPDVRNSEETPPDFDAWEDPDELLKRGPTRERVLDVSLQLREPTTVADVAERADCNTETARDYLEWFAEMGIVREHSGRPVRYELNRSYLRWRRIEKIRTAFTEEEIVAELREALSAIEDYREEFGVDSPDAVSLLDAEDAAELEDRWESLSAWKTALKRAELLEAARPDGSVATQGEQRLDV